MNHQVITHDVEPPSSLDMFVGMVSKTADEQGVGWTKPVSLRLPILTVVSFDALAAHSGQSRNKLMAKALEAALDLLWEQLPAIERATIEAHRGLLLETAVREVEQGRAGHQSGEI